jgi:imidazolonepropionase-like amidohydrolase
VGPRMQVKIPADAQIIDVQGGAILPGFINAHVHNAYSYTNLVLWAIAGVTTVRDLGAPCSDSDDCQMYLKARDNLNAQPKNARLVAVGPLVTVPNGYPLAFQNFASLTITSPNDAQQKVGQLLDDGADGIKIVIESGFPTLSFEETTAIVAIAHERHTWVSVHLTFSVDLEQAVKAGVDDVAHVVIDPLPEEWLQRMIADDIYLVPTLKAMEILNLPSRPHDEVTNLHRFVAAGGKVALGSDAGYIQGLKVGMPLDEILELKAAGMTPMQIIVAATKNAAHVCGLENELGTLEEGKTADVFVVSGDPLQNLEALANVQLVIHDGIVILNEIH